MEDEDGYLVLTPQPHNRVCMRYSQAEMTRGVHTSSRRYKITIGILGACCILLGLSVIVLGVFVFQCSFYKEEVLTVSNVTVYEGGNQTSILPECSPSFDSIVTHLKRGLCDSPTESSECKLCPMKWKSEKGKCYWFSKETKNWSEAHESCSRKNAHMIVFQDSEERDFIHNFTQGNYRFWIGLNFTSDWKNWTWIDGSLLNQTLFPVSVPNDGHRCGVLKVNQILPEMCNDHFKWICQKNVVLIEHAALKRGLI